MAELKVVTREAGAISFNYEELKGEIMAKASEYSTAVYTEENIGFAKADRAKLNKLKTALNDERLKQERAFMKPFMEFKEQINELIKIIDEPIKTIDTQVKAFEDAERAEKRKACIEQFEDYKQADDFPSWLRYEQIESNKWYNKTTSLSTVHEEIGGAIQKVISECDMIQNYCPNPEVALAFYKKGLDLKGAMELGRAVTLQNIVRTPVVADPEEEASWVCFKALMTPTQAKALVGFFKTNNIEYKKGEQ